MIEIVKKEGLGYLEGIIKSAAYAVTHEKIDMLWEIAREAPKTIAERQEEFIVQMIDEFQFLNAMIYRDKETRNLANTLAGGYLSTAESKIAPLLVSGSWIDLDMLSSWSMIPPRGFRIYFPENIEQDETLEIVS